MKIMAFALVTVIACLFGAQSPANAAQGPVGLVIGDAGDAWWNDREPK